jgi:hypothetical protein
MLIGLIVYIYPKGKENLLMTVDVAPLRFAPLFTLPLRQKM